VRKFKLFESEFVRMGDDEAVTTVPDIEESKEHNETKKGQSTTTTTTTVLTKTWLLGFPSVDENAEVKEFEDTKEIRERFDDLTKNTDSLLEELNKLQVAKCKKESSEEQTVYATNTRNTNAKLNMIQDSLGQRIFSESPTSTPNKYLSLPPITKELWWWTRNIPGLATLRRA